MNDFSIGILGGMGTYATLHLFQRYVAMFPAEKEWERPRIIIDNNCTMPSRVRAFIYGEKKKELVSEMAGSISLLMSGGVKRIILACNTSHIFLDDVYKIIPEAKGKVVNIVDVCVKELIARKVKNVYLLATEGTILSGVYQKKLEAVGIQCTSPSEDDFTDIRYCIEAVKQNSYDQSVKRLFSEMVNRSNACILGCTELPILYDMYRDLIKAECIYDPLEMALNQVHEEYLRISNPI